MLVFNAIDLMDRRWAKEKVDVQTNQLAMFHSSGKPGLFRPTSSQPHAAEGRLSRSEATRQQEASFICEYIHGYYQHGELITPVRKSRREA